MIESAQSPEMALLRGGAFVQSKAMETGVWPPVDGVGGGQAAAPAAQGLFTMGARPRQLPRRVAAVVTKSTGVIPNRGQGFLAHIAFRALVGQGQSALHAAVAGHAQGVESGAAAEL